MVPQRGQGKPWRRCAAKPGARRQSATISYLMGIERTWAVAGYDAQHPAGRVSQLRARANMRQSALQSVRFWPKAEMRHRAVGELGSFRLPHPAALRSSPWISAVYSTEVAHGGAGVGQKSVLDAVTNRQCGAMARASCRPNRSPPSPCEPLEGAIAPAPSDFYAAVILGAFHGQTGGNGDGGGHPQRVWRRWRRWRWRAGVATRRDTCACSGSDGTRADGGARARPHTCAFACPHAQPDIAADTCAHARAVTCAFARPHAQPDTCADTCTHARADAGPRPRRGAVRQCRDLGRLDHGADFAQRAGPDAGTHGVRRQRHR
jgi:hypothetical protein